MKKLILYDHIGTKLLELDIFVEGQDFTWKAPRPVAYWLGKILIVNKEPELKFKEVVEAVPTTAITIIEAEEEKVEPETVNNQGAGDERASEASQSESVEELPQQPSGGEPSPRDKRTRKRKAA